VLCVVALTGCRAGQVNGAPPAERTRLTVGLAVPAASDDVPPSIGIGVAGAALSGAGLVRVSRDGRPQPGLAMSWKESNAGTRWTFHLRPGLTFHDGRPLNAEAVASYLRESLQAPMSTLSSQGVARIDAIGETVLEIELEHPSSFLLESLRLNTLADRPNGTEGAGPYHVVSADTDRIVLEAFDGYYEGRPAIDEVEIIAYPAARIAWAAMMRGEIDFLYDVPPEALEFVEATSDVMAHPFLRPFTFLIALNLERPALAPAPVRRALNLAIDRESIVRTVFMGHGRPAYDPVWPRFWAYDDRVPHLRHAPDDAVRLLDTVLDRPGERTREPGADGPASRLRFTCLVLAGVPRYEQLAMTVQRQLYEVDVDMRLEPVPLREFVARIRRRDFDAVLVDLVAGLGMGLPYEVWHSKAGTSLYPDTGYQAADAILDAVRAAMSDDEMRAAVSAFQRVVRDDPPAIFLAWGETVRAVRDRFQIPELADRDVFSSIPQWNLRAPGSVP